MKKLTKTIYSGLLCMTALAWSSCSGDSQNDAIAPQGELAIDVRAHADFKSTTPTRAVSEADYKQTDNYLIEIINDKGAVTASHRYADIPASIRLSNGSYTLRATYGQDYRGLVASREGFYVAGEKSFIVQGDNVTVSADCYPTVGKLTVSFADDMSEYFSQYYVEFQTQASRADNNGKIMWAKDDTEPWYATLSKQGEEVTAVITYTRKADNKTLSQALKYTMTPSKQWTLTLVPKDDNGNMGIEITIDESVNDRPIDIEVPSDWI